MSERDKKSKINSLLAVPRTLVAELSLYDFLVRLKAEPVIADSAHALLVSAIEEMGEVDIDAEPEYRRPYLKMLKKLGIPTYKAFDTLARGSQLTVHKLMTHLRAAGQHGYQERQAIILKGGPGSGKGCLALACKYALEGKVVYAVEGCPINENPINLLKRLSKSIQRQVAEELDMIVDGRDLLKEMIDNAGEPCDICKKRIADLKISKIGFEADRFVSKDSCLGQVKVQALRLAAHEFGIATWAANDVGVGALLLNNLAKGNRGVVNMPEMFSLQAMPQLETLLEATNDKQMPLGIVNKQLSGFMPLDAVLIGETNQGAWDRFIANQKDPEKFTRRFFMLDTPYILSVSDEELAYREYLDNLKQRPHVDPLVLKLTALLAVISRMVSTHPVDILSRARMYDGEELMIKKPTTAGSPRGQSPGDYWTVEDMWGVANVGASGVKVEGLFGLNITKMLSLVGEAAGAALNKGKGKGGCISTVEMIRFMRSKLEADFKNPSGSTTQAELLVLQNCMQYLKAPVTKTGAPGIIEQEFRRLLYRQVMRCMAPDYDLRANELFERYRLFAQAYAQGAKRIYDEKVKREVSFDEVFLDELEKFMGTTSRSEALDFRRALEAHIMKAVRAHQDHDCDQLQIDWQTVPQLQVAIKKKLVGEISIRIRRLVQGNLELTEYEQKLKTEALVRFSEYGYCPHCQNVALEYFEEFELWNMDVQ